MKRFRGRFAVKFSVMAIIGIFIFGSIVMLLWNALMPVIFNLQAINFWQALGLLILSKIFFGGFRGGPWRGGRFKYWNQEMKQRWMNMTPEEREKFSQEWKERCNWRSREEKTSPVTENPAH